MKVRCRIHDQMMDEILDGDKIVPVCVLCVAKYNVQNSFSDKDEKKTASRLSKYLKLSIESFFVAIIFIPLFLLVAGGVIYLYSFFAALIITFIFNAINAAIGGVPEFFTPYNMHITIGIVVLSIIAIGINILLDQMKERATKRSRETFEYKYEKEVERLKQLISSREYALATFISRISMRYDHENAEIKNIDQYSGVDFEDYIAFLFQKDGYIVSRTPSSGDDGVDLVIQRNDQKVAVQCKRYSSKISVSAIQEVYAGKDMYDCDEAVVITNSYFTTPARKMANKLNVALWDRDELIYQINTIMPPIVSWNEYIKDYYDLNRINKVEI